MFPANLILQAAIIPLDMPGQHFPIHPTPFLFPPPPALCSAHWSSMLPSSL